MTVWQQISIVALRFAVGWHLFLEGYGKLVASQWWAEAPLSSASGPLAPVLRRMSESPWLFVAAERTTSYGLMVLGVLLMVGLLTRTASFLAIALLAAYLLAHPPLPVSGFLLPNAEGTGMYVNPTLIELLGLVASFAFDSGRIAGLDVVLLRRRREKAERSLAVEEGTNWSIGPRP